MDRPEGRAATMDGAFDDACVCGWEPLVQGIALPDEDDRHVVTAALRAQADLIVTANLSDVTASSLAPSGLEAQGPDDFLLNQLDLDPDVVIRVLHARATATQRPASTFDTLVGHLARCGVPQFAQAAAQQKWRGPCAGLVSVPVSVFSSAPVRSRSSMPVARSAKASAPASSIAEFENALRGSNPLSSAM